MAAQQRSSMEPGDPEVRDATQALSSSGSSDGAETCASPVPATRSSGGTGAVTATGLVTTTTVANHQAGAATAGGGTAPTSQVNETNSAASGTGTAEGQSADAATDAPLGDATATGARTTSAVSTTTAGAVSVGGANAGPVTVRSTTVTGVDETATASATSGEGGSWGRSAGAAGCPMGMAGGGTIVGEQSAVIVPVGGTEPVTIVHQASAEISAVGVGVAAPSPGEPGGGGSAIAVGLTTQDRVVMHADVAVRVGGDNHGLIELVIEAAAYIRNVAGAAAASGVAALGIHADGATAPAAVIGAAVRNVVQLASSLTVSVMGDNHTPIDILVDLASSIFNWGRGDSSSAGGASAHGLDTSSLVDLVSFIRVDVQGSNYAPIRIRVRLGAGIWNEGYAYAIGGDTLVSGPTPESALGSARDLRSGDASCVGASSLVGMTNVQVGVARGPDPAASNVADLSAKLDGAARCGSGDVRISATASDLVSAASGNALAVGADLEVAVASVQDAVARAGDSPEETAAPASDASPQPTAPSPPAAPPSLPTPGPMQAAAPPVAAAVPEPVPSAVSTQRKGRAAVRTRVTRPAGTVQIRSLPATASTPGGAEAVAVLIILPAAAAALWVIGRRERRRSSQKEIQR